MNPALCLKNERQKTFSQHHQRNCRLKQRDASAGLYASVLGFELVLRRRQSDAPPSRTRGWAASKNHPAQPHWRGAANPRARRGTVA